MERGVTRGKFGGNKVSGFWVGEEEERYTEFVFGCVTKSTDERKTAHSDRTKQF